MLKLDQDYCAIYKDVDLPVAKALNVKDHRKSGNLFDPCPVSVLRFIAGNQKLNFSFNYY